MGLSEIHNFGNVQIVNPIVKTLLSATIGLWDVNLLFDNLITTIMQAENTTTSIQPCNKLVTALQTCSNFDKTKLQPYKVAATFLQPRFFHIGIIVIIFLKMYCSVTVCEFIPGDMS